MSLPGDVVDVVMRIITGGVEMTKAQREAAKQGVRDTLARADEKDRRELLSVRADAVTEKHLARVRAKRIAGAVVPIDAHADHVAELLTHAAMPLQDRESIEALIEHARGPIAGELGDPDERWNNGG